MHQHPGLRVIIGDQGAIHARFEKEIQHASPAFRQGPQVRREVDHEIVCQRFRAFHLDAQRPANLRTGSIGSNHIVKRLPVLLSRLSPDENCIDTVTDVYLRTIYKLENLK